VAWPIADVLLDGRQALDRAGRERFDLVICDMKMPGLDGQNSYQSLARARNPLQERLAVPRRGADGEGI